MVKTSPGYKANRARISLALSEFTVPLLATDGSSKAEIKGPEAGVASVSYLGHLYEVRFAPTVKAQLGEEQYANRNGTYRCLVLEADGAEMTLELRLK